YGSRRRSPRPPPACSAYAGYTRRTGNASGSVRPRRDDVAWCTSFEQLRHHEVGIVLKRGPYIVSHPPRLGVVGHLDVELVVKLVVGLVVAVVTKRARNGHEYLSHLSLTPSGSSFGGLSVNCVRLTCSALPPYNSAVHNDRN